MANNAAPARFTYRPVVIEDVEWDGEFVVLAGGVEIGTIRRHPGTSEGYWGAWGAGRERFETRRQAAEYRFNTRRCSTCSHTHLAHTLAGESGCVAGPELCDCREFSA
jgi:hypothetical protein